VAFDQLGRREVRGRLAFGGQVWERGTGRL
jgi:hypothetical protein